MEILTSQDTLDFHTWDKYEKSCKQIGKNSQFQIFQSNREIIERHFFQQIIAEIFLSLNSVMQTIDTNREIIFEVVAEVLERHFIAEKDGTILKE